MNSSVAPKRERLRVGLLVDDLKLPAWVRRIIADVQGAECADIVLVVKKDTPQRPEETLPRRIWRNRTRLAYLAYRRMDDWLFRNSDDAFVLGDASDLVQGATLLRVTPRETKFCDYISEQDVHRIQEFRPDVLLRFGFRILKGSILRAARFGVWSYHHGDNLVNRGGPAGFWEVMHDRPVTGSVLQILNEDLDNGQVIYRSYAKTDGSSVWRNRNNYYWKSTGFVMRKLRDVFDDPKSLHNGSPGDELSVYSEPLYRKPTNIQTVALVGSYVGRRVREHVRRMYAPEQWALAYCASSEEGPQTSLYRFKEQLPPVGTSWADPFPVDEGNGFCVFFEEFDHATRRGHVAVSRLTRGGHFEAPVKIVERPHHLSYPFVFTWRGAWFMMPESSAASRIEIFAARKFPFEWTLEAVLFDSIRAVDSTLVKVADRWWLFTNINSHPATRNYDELSAFHAPTPFGPWTPHRRNPVKSDARSARSAGRFFQRNGNLFRPAQDCSGRYGSATIINRIEMLTCDTFEETAVTRVEPRWRAGLSGTHTLNHCPGLTVIDFRHRRTSFTPVAFRRDSDRRVAS